MKNILILAATTCFLYTTAIAQQVDRSKAPKSGPAPTLQVGDYSKEVLANGLTIIVVENHKIPKVSLTIDITTDEPLQGSKAGVADFTGTLLSHGTAKRSKDVLNEEIAFLGADVNTSDRRLVASFLTKYTEKVTELAADMMINPSFPYMELDKLKTQKLSELEGSKNESSSIASNLENVVNYGSSHPYGEIVTETSVKTISDVDCKKFYNTYYKANKAYLVFVGDITPAKAKELANKYFATWQKGEVAATNYAMPQPPMKNRVAFAEKEAAVQSSIIVTYPLDFKIGNKDEIAVRLMNDILGSAGARLYLNLREGKGYTYGCYSNLQTDKLVGYFSATAETKNAVTDSAIVQIMYELNKLVQEDVTAKELEVSKKKMMGAFAMGLEKPATIARFALNIEKYGLPKDYYKTYLKKVNQITIEDIRRVAKKYILPERANIIVVGNKDEVANKLQKLDGDGVIEYFDYLGNKIDNTAASSIPVGLTAEKVIDNYLQALGGKDKIVAIKTLKETLTANVQGMDIKGKTYKKDNKKVMVYLEMMGQTLMKQVYDGKTGKISGMQGNKELAGAELEAIKSEAYIVEEIFYQELGYKLTLKGIDKVDSKEAYKIEIVAENGNKSLQYFDTKTGLKVKEISTQENEVATAEYSDYKEINGVKFAHTIKQNTAGQIMVFKTQTIELNTPIEDSEFK